ncbi:MAG: hypothetical protein AAJB65_00300 [Candidatus Hodgkinia cicadicola]
MLALVLPRGRKGVFLYIKLYCMCKFVIGKTSVRFKPLYKKACAWLNNYYIILFWISQIGISLLLITTFASSWYRSVGRSLCYLKSSFYSVLKLPYSAKLFNRVGLNARNYKHNLTTCESLYGVECFKKRDFIQFYLIRGRVFKLCCHRLITRNEFELFNVNDFVAFGQLKQIIIKFLLRHTSNYTKRITRSVVCGSFSGGNVLWDLGSGCGGLGLCWCFRGGKSVVCFEKNKLRFKLNFYNARLALHNKRVRFIELDYSRAVFGVSLPDRMFFGCGLKQIWTWRLVYTHLEFGGRAIIVSVSNLGCLCLSLLNSVYLVNSYLLIVQKLRLTLNAKIYILYSSVFVSVIWKNNKNIL